MYVSLNMHVYLSRSDSLRLSLFLSLFVFPIPLHLLLALTALLLTLLDLSTSPPVTDWSFPSTRCCIPLHVSTSPLSNYPVAALTLSLSLSPCRTNSLSGQRSWHGSAPSCLNPRHAKSAVSTMKKRDSTPTTLMR